MIKKWRHRLGWWLLKTHPRYEIAKEVSSCSYKARQADRLFKWIDEAFPIPDNLGLSQIVTLVAKKQDTDIAFEKRTPGQLTKAIRDYNPFFEGMKRNGGI